ncbi:aldo/keto reductase [Cyanobacterium aponinum UTEX 3222]|uniref:Aldo/keto reductase n=2 Tax=Cyanobacterium aponinum TaxID=379064 RepID=K9Z1F2_CYAAP|nr:aldo/keto reductase [Cyanobacterium aponinum]WRL42393.1 aldo/keto reductase [Cyanobacterium aponinum UTEX 3222]AFZ52173.1 aldo/keto reductase [Cyanobacterium aponinum PCC 10605]MTF38179.1 aldo/keto reductase [Cyanobacterium aponinum 0216]PHV63960.1 aldo/keto reductase [Cyanobacterium aponinum IPPAS B-1201]WRL39611.1 aldo/keto reductase [Cyanobacterium aponinum UTEX 3221]
MKTRQLGKSDIYITPIIMGTWQAGKRMWAGIEDSESISAIRQAVESGITTIDTAEVYGEGHSERIVGEALKSVRDKVIYASKVFANHLKYDQVISACHNSLKNLQTDYIDLYQIHWPSGSWNSEIVPIEETMRALNDLKREGKIRAIGVSNFSQQQLASARECGQIDSIQPPYSLFWRIVEKEIQPYCVENNISILAYSSLAQGILTGKFGDNPTFAEGDHRKNNRLFQPPHWERVKQALSQLQPFADKYNCTLAQIAIAWLIQQPQTNAIVGARNAQQAKENAQAGEIELTIEDIKQISNIGTNVTKDLDDNPVMWNFS